PGARLPGGRCRRQAALQGRLAHPGERRPLAAASARRLPLHSLMKVLCLAAGGALVLGACSAVPREGSTAPAEAIRESPAALPPAGKAIATFESLGIYWKPPANPGSAGCAVRYRQSGEETWHEALPLWYDARNGECRGSIVHLTPGTQYLVRLRLPGQPSSAELKARTWSERFPIAKTIEVGERT